MLDCFLSFFLITWEILCAKLVIETFVKKRKYRYKIIPVAIYLGLIGVLYAIAYVLANHLWVKSLFVAFILSAAMYLLFKARFSKILALTVLYQGICLTSDCFGIMIFRRLYSALLNGRIDSPSMTYLVFVSSKIILLFIVLFIKCKMAKDTDDTLETVEWIELLIIPIIIICFIAAIVRRIDVVEQVIYDNVLLYAVFGMAVINIAVFFLIDSIFKREKKIRDTKVLAERMKTETEMYYAISANLDRQRKWTHEFKNHLSCICELARRGNYGELKEYVGKLDGELTKSADMIDTNNVIVNAIINTKYQEATERGIVFVLKINDLSNLTLSDMDIVTILTNLLNNAMEACEDCENKVIKLKFVIEDDQTIISVKNSLAHKPKQEKDTFLTSKTLMAEEHGMGIQNVCDVLKKYDAKYLIDYNEKEFSFSIII